MARNTPPMIESAWKIVTTMRAPGLPRRSPPAIAITTTPTPIVKIAVAISWLAPPNSSTIDATLVWKSRMVPPSTSSRPAIQVSTATSVTPPGRATAFDMRTPRDGRGRTAALCVTLTRRVGLVEEGTRLVRPEQDQDDRRGEEADPLTDGRSEVRDGEEQRADEGEHFEYGHDDARDPAAAPQSEREDHEDRADHDGADRCGRRSGATTEGGIDLRVVGLQHQDHRGDDVERPSQQ